MQNMNAYHSRFKHPIGKFKGVVTKDLNNYLTWMNVIQEDKHNRVALLKRCIKAVVFTRWRDLSKRPAVLV